MTLYLITITILVVALSAWVLLHRLSAEFARRHPEFGPAREEGHGCGACEGGSCAGKCH